MKRSSFNPFAKIHLIWLVSILVLSVLGVYGYSISKPKKSSSASNIGTVTRADLVQKSTVAGVVVPHKKTIFTAPYSGYIRKIYVEIGQKVKAGDPIISIAQSLKNGDEEVYPLRAPFAGTVVQVLRTEGEYVEQTSQNNTTNGMVRVDDLTQLHIEATAPEIEVSKLKIGQEGVIKALAVLSRSYQATIDHISLAAKEQDKWERSRVEFPVLMHIKDADHLLKPGMSTVVDIITKKLTQVLTLRHEFIQKEKDQYFVVTENGTRKNIEVGIQNEEVFEILKGLNEGEKIRQVDFLSASKEQ